MRERGGGLSIGRLSGGRWGRKAGACAWREWLAGSGASRCSAPASSVAAANSTPPSLPSRKTKFSTSVERLAFNSLMTPTVHPVAAAVAMTVSTRSTAVTSTSGRCRPVNRASSSTCQPSVSSAEMKVFGLNCASCGTATARRARVPTALMRIWTATAKETTSRTFPPAGEGTITLKGLQGGGQRGRGWTLTRPTQHPGMGAVGWAHDVDQLSGGACRPNPGSS